MREGFGPPSFGKRLSPRHHDPYAPRPPEAEPEAVTAVGSGKPPPARRGPGGSSSHAPWPNSATTRTSTSSRANRTGQHRRVPQDAPRLPVLKHPGAGGTRPQLKPARTDPRRGTPPAVGA